MRKYKISSNLAISENGFLFYPLTGESFTVNQMGVQILNLLKKEEKPEQIISAIIDEYDTDHATAERDLGEFLTQLKNYKLVNEL
ncbi:MAG: PqqD family protein [Bacteroidetes bacterium]|nr:PqqD family protein [Bacteroidota bacterium]MBU1679636.1 PqqD family protein [Bacteroidota bacterium]MBU2508507.1 PqqD family protein [Bacteroidota bacterium]